MNDAGLCMYSLSAFVVAASLKRDLDDLVSYTHIELTAAMQDQQASDRLSLPGREQLDLLQQAAPRRQVERGKHFPDSTVIWKRKRGWGKEFGHTEEDGCLSVEEKVKWRRETERQGKKNRELDMVKTTTKISWISKTAHKPM